MCWIGVTVVCWIFYSAFQQLLFRTVIQCNIESCWLFREFCLMISLLELSRSMSSAALAKTWSPRPWRQLLTYQWLKRSRCLPGFWGTSVCSISCYLCKVRMIIVMFVSNETRRVMTFQIQAIANLIMYRRHVNSATADQQLHCLSISYRHADRKLSNDLDQTAIQVRDKYDVWCKLIYSTSMTNVSSFIDIVSGN